MTKIDWNKPIETVPCDRNPVPVPCEFAGRDEDGDAQAFIKGKWFSEDGLNRGSWSWLPFPWYFDEEGDPHYPTLPFIRNVAEAD